MPDAQVHAEPAVDIDLKVGATLPGEYILGKFLEWNAKYRDTMDADIRRRWDLIGITIAERIVGSWPSLQVKP